MEPGLSGGGLLSRPDEVRLMDAYNVDRTVEFIRRAAEDWDGVSETQDGFLSWSITRDESMQVQIRLSDTPDLFYVQSVGFDVNRGYYYIQFIPERYTLSDVRTFQRKADEIMEQVEDGWTDVQKALWAYDYLLTHVTYDRTLSRFTAFDALVDGVCVCAGYASAYKYLTERAGLQCEVVFCESMEHDWNVVWVDGQSYYVDCTFGDGALEFACFHNQFLLGEADLLERGHRCSGPGDWFVGDYDIYNSGLARESYRNPWWEGSERAVAMKGSKAVYADWLGSEIYVHDCVTDTTETLCTIEDKWKYWGNDSFYVENYITVCTDGESFYASGPNHIYQISLDGRKEVYYTLTAEEQSRGAIYGIRVEDGALTYSLYTRPGKDAFVSKGSVPLGSHMNQGACSITQVTIESIGVVVQAENVPGGAMVCAFLYDASGQMLWADGAVIDSAQSQVWNIFRPYTSGASACAVVLDAGSQAPLCAPKRTGQYIQ